MIYEDSCWKNELEVLSKKLEMRLIQKRWTKKSFFSLEKEIFLGFFIIRKLVESNHVEKNVLIKKYSVYEYFLNANVVIEEVEINKCKKQNLDIKMLSNQFIHSKAFFPYIHKGRLIAIIVSSDYKMKNNECYLISIFEIINMYETISNNKI